MEAKPFSIGVRIEHPQRVIDRARFGPNAGNKLLGAADYRLAHHCANGRAVYSFCMCPGGRVVAATSEPGHVVTNGMSQYSRAEFNANAGIVVGIAPADYPGGVLAGVEFQRRWERAAFEAGGGDYRAPAQRVDDFLAGRPSTALGEVAPSYQPGTRPADLSACLPDYAVAAMREALPAFARQVPGFAMADAVMTGVETRTSSPVRLPRDARLPERQHRRPLPGRRGRGLRRRHPLRRRRRHPRRRSGGHGPDRPGGAGRVVAPPQRGGAGLWLKCGQASRPSYSGPNRRTRWRPGNAISPSAPSTSAAFRMSRRPSAPRV